MAFLKGTHNLSRQFFLTNITSLTLENETPGIGVIIFCSDDGRLMFERIKNVLIRNVTIIDCYGSSVTHAIYLAVTDSVIQGYSKHSSQAALYLSDVETLDVRGCKFASNNATELESLTCATLDVHNSNMKLLYSLFHQNFAESVNEHHIVGCALCIHNSNVTILGSEFTNNSHQSTMLSVSSDVTIKDSSFMYNRARSGGAMHIGNSSIRALHTTFAHNRATEYGGAIFLNSSGISQVTLDSCPVIDNQANWGGAIYSEGNSILALETTFVANHADKGGGAIYLAHNSSFTLDSCTVSENSCSIDGGAMYITLDSNLEAKNTSFQQNSALPDKGNAGVMVVASSYANLTNCSFVDNIANNSGVVSTYEQAIVHIQGCSFFNNTAYSPTLDHGYGGTINADGGVEISISWSQFVQNSASSSGGCAHIKDSILHLSNSNTFENNTATYGGAFTFRNSTVHINRYSCNDFTMFTGNSAQHGGALNIIENSLAHINCSRFEHNGATYKCENAESDSRNCRGGAILVRTDTNVSLVDTIFYENMAQGKGGAIFAQFSAIKSVGYLIFQKNRGEDGTVYMTSCHGKFTGNVSFITNEQSFLVHSNNIAFEGENKFQGGLSTNFEGGAITAIRSNLITSGTLVIENNKGIYGGAINMIKTVFVTFRKCQIKNNTAYIGGALNVYDSLLQFQGITEFQYNIAKKKGGSISAVSSTLQFHSLSSSVTFSYNCASLGGAIYFDQTSSLYIIKDMMEAPCNDWYCVNNTVDWMILTFASNFAYLQGGALYVNDTGATACNRVPYDTDPIYEECFLQTVAVYEKANDWDPTGVNFANVYFVNNTSPQGQGPTLYGGLLDRCAIDEYAEQLQFPNINMPTTISYFTALTSGFTYVEAASDAVRICFCEHNKTINCSKQPADIHIQRGQLFNVTLVIVNQMSRPVMGEVAAYLSSTNSSGRLGEDQSQQSIDETCTDLQFTVFSGQPETLNLYAIGPCDNNGISKAAIVIDIDEDCPVGFAPSDSSIECVCDPQIMDFITNCSMETETVQRLGNFWITSISDNVTIHFIIHDCPYDYCLPPTEIVNVDLNNVENGSDAQCAFGRVGLLCGSCHEGYSLTLGSSRCQKCSHYWLFLAFPFILAGIALAIFMMACNFTLASGTLNGLLFYVNILIANQSTFFPFQKVTVFTVFISWLGLNLGIPTCFFDGMDSYGKMWVQLSFEAYMIIIMIIITLLGRIVRVANFYHHHNLYPVHTLATITMLSYEKLSRKVFSLLAVAPLEYRNGTEYKMVWLFDPNEEYFKTGHIPLMIVGVCIIIIGTVFNLILIFNKVLIVNCNSVHFTQFVEAFTSPFKPNHHYWVGLLLLVRNISYVTSEVLNANQQPKYSLHVIFSLVIGILLLKFIYIGTPRLPITKIYTRCRGGTSDTITSDDIPIPEREVSNEYHGSQYVMVDDKSAEGIVYKNPYLDLLETSFLVNLSVLTYFTLYLKDNPWQGSQEILFYVSSSIVLLTFIGIVIYHICVYTSIKTFVSRQRPTGTGVITVSERGYGVTPPTHPNHTHSEL